MKILCFGWRPWRCERDFIGAALDALIGYSIQAHGGKNLRQEAESPRQLRYSAVLSERIRNLLLHASDGDEMRFGSTS
jgi:hypothetical protein